MINQRIFSANVGDFSVGIAGPDAIEQDIDNLLANDQELLRQINNSDAYAVASGTDTYTATIDGYTLVEGKSVKIKFTNANTSASTLNINSLGAKAIKKSNGNDLSSGNIKAGQICNLVYTGSVFQLLGEGGEYGTATASDVLQGKTIGTEDGLVDGTMPNRGTVTNTITTQGGSYTIPRGYHNGSGKVTASFANLTAGNIKSGVNIGGIVGTYLGKRFATGTKYSSGGELSVSQNFGFKPTIIIAQCTDAAKCSIYWESKITSNYRVANIKTSIDVSLYENILSVSTTGFRIQAGNNNEYNWIAIE